MSTKESRAREAERRKREAPTPLDEIILVEHASNWVDVVSMVGKAYLAIKLLEDLGPLGRDVASRYLRSGDDGERTDSPARADA